jgi:signal transduction histidine kinase
MAESSSSLEAIRRAFLDYDREVIRKNIKVGCAIGVVLMPAGVLLDHFVYGGAAGDKQILAHFLALRLWCSLLICIFWAIVATPVGRRHPRKLGVTLAMFPTFFMSLMIFEQGGSTSGYYAGLNLVLLVIGFVLYWTMVESAVAVSLVIAMYLGACLLHPGGINPTILKSNLYFLVLTGIIVVTGTYFQSRYRFREFSLRFQLDQNRAALEESNRKLKELDEVKSRFFANISHELRTPLTLLLAPLEALLQRQDLPEPVRDQFRTMHSNGMRLLKLINDLLALVRLESGRMDVKREPLQVAEFIQGLASAARQVADDKRLRLEVRVDPELGTQLIDRDKLEKIVLNLLFNALKFTPSGGRVGLLTTRHDEFLQIIVEDNGMGISRQNLHQIFGRFWQADDSSRRKYQGVGIGLSLVKELVEIQNGTVAVESEEGKGTKFTVRLPYLPAPGALTPTGTTPGLEDQLPESGESPSSEEWLTNLYRRAELFPAMTPVHDAIRPVEVLRNGKHSSILVADDEPEMLRFLRSQLAMEYQVLEAVDGQQAIEKASQFLPDIILLDMMMPEKDGLQACREIRQHTPTQSIPIIMLTARADEQTKIAALSAGASEFLTKPFSTVELKVRIRNLIQSNEFRRKLSRQNQALETAIEQLKDTETQLVQSEKVASLGVMSAGIIHDINNPLNFANMGLRALKGKSKYVDPEQRADFDEILKDVDDGVRRVRDIVSDLRVFAHPETGSRDAVPLNDAVAISLRLLSNEWKDKVEIIQTVPENQTAWGNRNLLTQVLVNLLKNSLDALQSKSFGEGERPTLWIEGRSEAGRSLLVLRDNGPGIDAEHLPKIFDPFFTTKDVGKGMGLGLAICYRIVQSFEGKITVRTEPGQFCEFTLDFPQDGPS